MELDLNIVVQVVIWVVVGALAGTLAAMIIRGRRGFGKFGNILLGMVGALVGGLLFRALNIDFGLEEVNISLEDLIAAFAGSLLVLLIWNLIRRR